MKSLDMNRCLKNWNMWTEGCELTSVAFELGAKLNDLNPSPTWLYEKHGGYRRSNMNCLPIVNTWVHARCFGGGSCFSSHSFSVLCCVVFWFYLLVCVLVFFSPMLSGQCLWIVNYWLVLRFSLVILRPDAI